MKEYVELETIVRSIAFLSEQISENRHKSLKEIDFLVRQENDIQLKKKRAQLYQQLKAFYNQCCKN